MSFDVSPRDIPAVDVLLKNSAIEPLVDGRERGQIVSWIRDAAGKVRNRIMTVPAEFDSVAAVEQAVVSEVLARADSDATTSLQHVINATGVLLHTNLGRAPLAERALSKMREAAAYTNLELNLESGKRSQRGERVMQLLCRLTGADAAVVVNNCAAATVLVLQAIAGGKEVIVSRGQLVEIGGGFRLPDVFASAGVFLREVGTTNRTYIRDYESALNELTGAVIRVHRSNFYQGGFTTEPSIKELVECPTLKDVAVIDDLGSGLVTNLQSMGIAEPLVQGSVESNADICMFSGDKLFGGPQCGIIVGKKAWLQKIRSHPLMRALRCDKLTLAALEATAEIHLEQRAFEELPLFQMLRRTELEVRSACESLLSEIACNEKDVEIVSSVSRIGGGSLPHVELPSFALSFGGSALQEVASKLRQGKPAVLARQANDRLLVDLRTVMDHELGSLASCLSRAFA